MKNLLILLILVFTANISLSQNRQLAITIDDIPRSAGMRFSTSERADSLIAFSKRFNFIPALFCNSAGFDEEGLFRMKKYTDAGFIIANHTHSHDWIDKIGIDNYIKDIFIADSILSMQPNFRKWFRYPFLYQGKDSADRNKIWHSLDTSGYLIGYVTVDNYDWYLEKLFQDALKAGKEINYEKLKEFYVNHIFESIEFYDNISKESLGRSVKHVVLLHENDLAALFLDDLIEKLTDSGWEIISPDDAYNDEIAHQRPDIKMQYQGRVAALAKSLGYKGPFVQISEDRDYLDKLFSESGIIE